MIRYLLTATALLVSTAPSPVCAGSGGASPQSIPVSQIESQLTTPHIYAVSAYVIRKDDQCPPCPPGAVCETCQLGILIADSPDTTEAGLYLATMQAARFEVGASYLFHIRYRFRKNPAGAWQLEGPQLVDYAPAETRGDDTHRPDSGR